MSLWRRLQKFVLPAQCVVTGEGLWWSTNIENLSDDIYHSLYHLSSVCPVCAEYSVDGGECGACLTKMPAFDHTQVAYAFEGDLKSLIYRFKFQSEHYCVQVLADLMLESLDGRGIDALLPVPLHLSRLQSRGFNQSLELAKILSKALNIPIIEALTRKVATPQQVGLNRQERLTNLKGVFGIKTEALVGFKKVALVDDVMTTGSTMQSLSALIKQKTSVEWVEAWVIARTLKD